MAQKTTKSQRKDKQEDVAHQHQGGGVQFEECRTEDRFLIVGMGGSAGEL